MRIGLYDPYLDTLGGGEKYILDIASILSKNNHVDIFWDNAEILPKASERFDIDLSRVSTTANTFSKKVNFFSRLQVTKSYDRILYVSNGSIPSLFAKRNILLFQFPVPWVSGKTLLNRLKLHNVTTILCYSDFVKRYLESTFTKKITVLVPPIVNGKRNEKRENIILTVGRFTKGMNTKKQKEMIAFFKQLYDRKKIKNWKFILAGGMLDSDLEFVEDLKEEAKKYPIEIYENIPHENLQTLYQKAKIYWHAAGFGEDLEKHPEKAEHFGMTTIEAMSYGAVPVVFRGGGQIEIVSKGVGYTWTTENELLEETEALIEDTNLWRGISHNAIERAKDFTEDLFAQKVQEIFA